MGTIELKIGEIKDGIKCVEDIRPGCSQCIFYAKIDSKCIDMICINRFRLDKKGVHFIKVDK